VGEIFEEINFNHREQPFGVKVCQSPTGKRLLELVVGLDYGHLKGNNLQCTLAEKKEAPQKQGFGR
jgi:hypothetical protein